MLVSQDVLDMLKTIGLNKYERNLWIALLSRGVSTVGELANISKVPRSRCYDVLESLAEKGFVIIQPGKPIKYVAVEPKEAFERARQKVLEDAEILASKLEKIKTTDVAKELEKLYKTGLGVAQPEELAGAIKGRKTIIKHIEMMLRNTKKEVNLVLTEPMLRDIIDSSLNVLKKASKKGVKIKIVTETDKVLDLLDKINEIAEIKNLGSTAIESGKLCVIDNKEFLLGLTDDYAIHHTQDIAIWSNSEHATKNLIKPYFTMIWENATKTERK